MNPFTPANHLYVTRVMEMLISCIKSRLKRMHFCGINHLGQLGVLHLSTPEKPWTESTRSLHQTHPCLQDGSGYARLVVRHFILVLRYGSVRQRHFIITHLTYHLMWSHLYVIVLISTSLIPSLFPW